MKRKFKIERMATRLDVVHPSNVRDDEKFIIEMIYERILEGFATIFGKFE